MEFQLLQNMASGHVKVKKGTGHVIYTATPSHATESVVFHVAPNHFNNYFGRVCIQLAM